MQTMIDGALEAMGIETRDTARAQGLEQEIASRRGAELRELMVALGDGGLSTEDYKRLIMASARFRREDMLHAVASMPVEAVTRFMNVMGDDIQRAEIEQIQDAIRAGGHNMEAEAMMRQIERQIAEGRDPLAVHQDTSGPPMNDPRRQTPRGPNRKQRRAAERKQRKRAGYTRRGRK